MSDIEGEVENILKTNDVESARKKLLEILQSGDIDDDLRERLKAMLFGSSPLFGDYDQWTGTLLAFGFAVLLFSVILFFGYKLYKSIKEKEKKKEEKKKAKQMKKKK